MTGDADPVARSDGIVQEVTGVDAHPVATTAKAARTSMPIGDDRAVPCGRFVSGGYDADELL